MPTLVTIPEARQVFEDMHAGRSMQKHHLRGTYLNPAIPVTKYGKIVSVRLVLKRRWYKTTIGVQFRREQFKAKTPFSEFTRWCIALVRSIGAFSS